MKTGLIVATATLIGVLSTIPSAQARDRDERQSVYSEGRGGQSQHNRDNSSRGDRYGQRDDQRGQNYHDRRDNNDDRDSRHRHRDRDRDRDRVYYRDNHRHYRDYDPYPRHVIVERHYRHPRNVIYYTDNWGYQRYYYVNDDYWEHYYDHAYFRHGRHHHVGCHYHGFLDAVATGIVIGAIVGDW